MPTKIYKTGKEFKDLTRHLAETLEEKTIAIGGASILTSRLPKSAIDPAYKAKRPGLVEDNGKYHVTAILNNKGLHFGIWSPDRKLPLVVSYEGNLAKGVMKELGIGPDLEQDACCI